MFLLTSFWSSQRFLQLKKKSFDRTITELQTKATKEAVTNNNEVLQKLDDLVREREEIRRKLLTTYSLGRDDANSRPKSKSLLPLYDGKPRSFSFEGSKKERITIFQTLSDTTSSTDGSDKETSSDLHEDEFENRTKEKAKELVEEVESSSDDDDGIISKLKL